MEEREGPQPEPEPRPELVQTTDHFYHVRVRPKGAFAELRTPPEVEEVARSVVGAGADVRVGELGPETGRWVVESVLVPLPAAEDGPEAEALASALVRRVESDPEP